MAIARGAGTEIIRTLHLEEVDVSTRNLIVGVQHHIYTVLSITCYAGALNAASDWIQVIIHGYDSLAGTTDRDCIIFRQDMQVQSTFVWNEKFSFNGYEPINFTGPMDNATKQDAIADQGSGVGQFLQVGAEHASDNIDVSITYIDQNNA